MECRGGGWGRGQKSSMKSLSGGNSICVAKSRMAVWWFAIPVWRTESWRFAPRRVIEGFDCQLGRVTCFICLVFWVWMNANSSRAVLILQIEKNALQSSLVCRSGVNGSPESTAGSPSVLLGTILDLGKGSLTIIVCHDYCNSRKKVVPMVASKKHQK